MQKQLTQLWDPNHLPATRTRHDDLAASPFEHCQFGIERPGGYGLLFERCKVYGGVAFAASAAERAFNDLVTTVRARQPDTDALAISPGLQRAV